MSVHCFQQVCFSFSERKRDWFCVSYFLLKRCLLSDGSALVLVVVSDCDFGHHATVSKSKKMTNKRIHSNLNGHIEQQ